MTFKFPDTNLTWLSSRTVFLTRHGSHAYGTNIETSDEDFKGLAVPPLKYLHGYLEAFHQAEFSHRTSSQDIVVYDIRKFFRLAADCNPNIIEVLFTAPEDHVITTRLGQRLLEKRDLFLSKKAKHTFGGYAVSQLKKLQSHYRRLVAPPVAPPVRADFGLPERTVIPADQLAAAKDLIRKKVASRNVPMDELDESGRIAIQERFTEALTEIGASKDLEAEAGASLGMDSNFLQLLDRERQYRARMEEWRSYQGWLATRNPARSELESRFGYDTKHGMHLVRLLRMGEEILSGKGVLVKRPDADELKAIRAGAWSYETLMEWAQGRLKVLDGLYETSKAVPMAPDRKALDRLCQDMVGVSFEDHAAFREPEPLDRVCLFSGRPPNCT